MAPENEMVKKEAGALAAAKTMADMPEIQPVEEGDTIRIPRLNLIQEKRKEIKEGLAQAGDFFNSLTKNAYGREIKVVPLVQRPLTRIRWPNRQEGGGSGILCISRNKGKPYGDPGNELESCEGCQYLRDTNPRTGCSMNYEIISLLINGEDPRFWEPMLITAESTRPSEAGFRDILANVRYNAQRGVRMFHKAYVLKSVEAQNKLGEFYKASCIPADGNKLLPLDVIDFLETQVRFFLGAKIDTSGVHNEDEGVAAAPKDDPNW